MSREIHLSLKPNEDKTFNADFIKDGELVRQSSLEPEKIKLYMQEHLDEEQIIQTKKLIKLFKCDKITFKLKD